MISKKITDSGNCKTNRNQMEKFIVKKKIEIKATPDEVWDALTNPEKTKKYFFKSKVFSDWKKGSSITFKGKIFFIINFEMRGKILEIEPQKILKYNLKNSNSSSESIVTDKLTFEKGTTNDAQLTDPSRSDGDGSRHG